MKRHIALALVFIFYWAILPPLFVHADVITKATNVRVIAGDNSLSVNSALTDLGENVRWRGTIVSGDNVSDSAAIQSTFDNAVAGDEIIIPNGIWRITDNIVVSTSYLKIKCPGRATLTNIDNGTIMEFNGVTDIEVEGCEFKGYSPSASVWAGTGVNMVGSGRIKFRRCIFNQLDTGIDFTANGVSNENQVTESLFNGISGYGIRHRNGNSILWATNNTFQNGGLTGVGYYSGYNSGVKLRNNSFTSFPIAIDIHGAQVPVLSGNYFENNDNNVIFDEVACTDAGCPGDTSYDARNPLITGNEVIFKGTDDSFVKARNTRGMNLIGNWSSAQGYMLDVDNTVTMITYIGNIRDNSATDDFKNGIPNNMLLFAGDEINSSTEEEYPVLYIPRRIYAAPKENGGQQIVFTPDGTNNVLILGPDYLQVASPLDLTFNAAGKGPVLKNAAGTVTKRVRLNDAGDGLIYEDP